MTYYKRQLEAISTKIYANVYLTTQIIQVKYFLDRNFANNISLKDICKAGCISKFHLIRSFKKLYGKIPNQYLTSIRISRAKKLLRDDHSVLEVCFDIGLASPTTFAALFKKYVGLTPSHFKRFYCKKSNFEEV